MIFIMVVGYPQVIWFYLKMQVSSVLSRLPTGMRYYIYHVYARSCFLEFFNHPGEMIRKEGKEGRENIFGLKSGIRSSKKREVGADGDGKESTDEGCQDALNGRNECRG